MFETPASTSFSFYFNVFWTTRSRNIDSI